ncbi:hypothetical protein GC175_03505 [bacterium]|nr:hypothetical protein [bacterium]
MPKDRSLVRAGDIGAWVYCNRAWWLANVKDVAPANVAELDAGTRAHHAHGRTVRRAHQLQRLGYLFLAVGMILAGIALLVNVIGGLL